MGWSKEPGRPAPGIGGSLRKDSSGAAFEVSDGLLDDGARELMVARDRELIVREAIPARRQRSCPRKVRQPVRGWPRLTKNESSEGGFVVEVVNFP